MPRRFSLEALIDRSWEPFEVRWVENRATVEFCGNEVTVHVQVVSAGCYSLLIDNQSYDVTVGGERDLYHVNVNGQTFDVRLRDPKQFSGGHTGGEGNDDPVSVSTPMPGKVVKLLVQQGDSVIAGQGLAVVEAMKMQNELRSPKAGRVITVNVQENQAVNAGESLMIVN